MATLALPQKRFEMKKSATRAARNADLQDNEFEVLPVEVDGKTMYKVHIKAEGEVAPENVGDRVYDTVKGQEVTVEEAEATSPTVAEQVDHITLVEDSKKITDPGVVDEPVKKLVIYDTTVPAEAEKFAQEVGELEKKPTVPAGPVLRKPRVKKGGGKIPQWATNRGSSLIESPVKFAWELADTMTAANNGQPPRRKDYIQEAEKQGLAYGTARSQYQSWFTARRESEANAAKANGKK